MILIGLGANLPHPRYGSPRQTLEAALRELERRGVRLVARSRWYRSAPVPPSDQAWFVNGVAVVESELSPRALLELLHAVEADFGRKRRERNEARTIDLDLLVYGTRVEAGPEAPILPHPRMAERAFVILPLAELAPDWRHPVSGLTARELAATLPEQAVEPLNDSD